MQCIAWLRCAAVVIVGLGLSPVGHAEAPPAYPLGRDLSTFDPTDPGALRAPEAPEEPTGAIALRDALAAALLGSPELAADAYELRAREAWLLQAGAYPNPSLSLQVEDVAGSGPFRGVRSAQTTLQLGQLVELGGKRAARVEVATAERDLAAWDAEIRRIGVLARTAGAFVDVLAAQERRQLAEEALEVARSVQEVALRRRRAGLASAAEEIRAEVETEVAGVELEHTEHELATARQHLAASWGGEQPRFQRAAGDLERLPVVPSAEALSMKLAQSPGVARWQTELERRHALRTFSRNERVPDVLLSAGPRYVADTDDSALVLGIQLPLPLWNRNRGAIAAAEHGIARAKAEARAARVRSAADLAAARVALHAAAEEAELLRSRVLPGVLRARDVVRQGYEAGRFSQLEILEAERSRIRAREQYLQVLTEAHHSAREIERLTGVALETRP